MAKFGKWGALAGLGKGVMDVARDRTEQLAAERQATIDEARERRLMEYKAKVDAEARTQSGDIEAGLIGVRGGEARKLATHEGSVEADLIGERTAAESVLGDETRRHQTGERREEQDWRSGESQLERESRERIAGRTSVSAAAIEARERFVRTEIMASQPNAVAGFPDIQVETPAIFDKQTNSYLIQKGTRYVPAGGGPITLPSNERAAVQRLIENPETSLRFMQDFGYLPAEYVQTLPKQLE